MPIGMLYWILMLLALLSSFYWGYTTPQEGRRAVGGWSLLIWLLFLLIGLKLFGHPIQ